MKDKDIISKGIDVIMTVAMVAIVCVVTLQVLGRTPLLTKAPHWTEELSRMIFIVIVAFGSIAATMKNEFVAVDLLVSKLSGKALVIYNIFIDLLIGAFFFVLTPACIKFVNLGAKQLSPSLRINMGYLYSLIFVCILGMGFAQLYKVIKGVISLKTLKEAK